MDSFEKIIVGVVPCGRPWFLASLLVGFLFLGLLTGCSPEQKPVDERKNIVEIEFWTLQMLNFSDYIEGMISEYERMHPGVKIKWVDVPFSEGEKKALTSMLANRTPDVINLNPDFSAILASRGALLDMNEWVPAEKRESFLPIAWQAASLGNERVFEKFHAASRCKAMHSRAVIKTNQGPDEPCELGIGAQNRSLHVVNEDSSTTATPQMPPKETCQTPSETFGIPWYISSAVTLYNREVLKKAGESAPPKTYGEMAAMAKSIKKAGDGDYILMPSIADGGRFFRVLKKAGIPIWDDKRERLIFSSKGAGRELDFWVRLYRDELVPRESITEGQQAAVDRYQSGTLGLLLTGPNFLNIVRENSPDIFKNTDVAPQFPEKSPFMDFSEMILVIPKRTEHPKEAVDFALFVTNPENSLKLSELAPVLPPHTSLLQSETFRQLNSSDLLLKARSISARQLLSATETLQIHPLQNRLNQLMDYYVQSALLGKISPESAMQKAQAEMNRLIEESK